MNKKRIFAFFAVFFSIIFLTISVSAAPYCGTPGSYQEKFWTSAGSYEFEVPENVNIIGIRMSGAGAGAGGGGGAGVNDIGGGGGGGGAGQYKQLSASVTPSQIFTFQVGKGGIGGIGGPEKGDGGNGQNGESTTIQGPGIPGTVYATSGNGGGGGKGASGSGSVSGYGGKGGAGIGGNGEDGYPGWYPNLGKGGKGGGVKGGGGGLVTGSKNGKTGLFNLFTDGVGGGGGGGGGFDSDTGGMGGIGADGYIYISYTCAPCDCADQISCDPSNNGKRCDGCYYTVDVSANKDDVCDNIDADCDGQFNENYASYGIQIGVGECKEGVTSQCIDGVEGFTAQTKTPQLEICDDKDNDCDGLVDECLGDQACYNGQCVPPALYWAGDSLGQNKLLTPPSLDSSVGNSYYLVLENPPIIPQNKVWKFSILEYDLANSDDSIRAGANSLIGVKQGNKIIAAWTVSQNDIDSAEDTLFDGTPFKFYFKVAERTGQAPGGPILTGGAITGFQLQEEPILYEPEFEYQSKVLELEFPGAEPAAASCFDDVQNQGETGIDCGGPCPACEIVDCTQYPSCSSYPQTLCASDPCSIAEESVLANNPQANCDENSCECFWSIAESTCAPSYIVEGDLGFPIGSCNYNEDTTDTCEDDNLLTYSWVAEWAWSAENGNYKLTNGQYYDPENKALECVDGEQTISCPAQVKLPFTGWFGIIGSVIFIILGYILFSRRNA